ncbi:20195_t:CDS:2, partial [Gigaspora margarita]
LSSEYKSDSLSLVDSEVDYDTEGDSYFRDDDDSTKLAVSCLAASAASLLKISQFFSSTNPVDELSNKTKDESESNNEDTTKQDEISEAIEFVNEIIHKDQLSNAKRAHYTAKKKIEASETVAKVVELVKSSHGKHSSKSLLNDEFVLLQVAAYLRSQKFKVNPAMVKTYVEQQNLYDQFLLELLVDGCINLAFNISVIEKAIISIGMRNRIWLLIVKSFFKKSQNLSDLCPNGQYDESCEIRTFPQLADNEKEHIWVIYDETTFYIYDGQHAVWGPEDNLEEVYEMMVIGSRYNGFWDAQKLLQQVKCAINVFERTHPGCIDNSFVEDALVASKMNLGLGSSVPKMQDTVWNGERQSMVIEENHFVHIKKTNSYINLHGKPKGIKLTDRGLWQEGMSLECISCKEGSDSNIIDCCARRLMANQPDFVSQRG